MTGWLYYSNIQSCRTCEGKSWLKFGNKKRECPDCYEVELLVRFDVVLGLNDVPQASDVQLLEDSKLPMLTLDEFTLKQLDAAAKVAHIESQTT